jgi:hypothetical protein
VLSGGLETLLAYHPRLIIEDHTRVYPWVAEHLIAAQVCTLLFGLDYKIECFPYADERGFPFARDFIVAT